jgi:hypothetical protein
MKAWPIGARVNSPKNNDSEIIVPVELESVSRPENQPPLLMHRTSQIRRTIFAESSFAMSIPRSVNRIESEISPRSFSRLSERLSDVRAAFAFSGPAVALSITSHLCP